MRILVCVFIFLSLVLSYFASQRPLISDLLNYHNFFYDIKNLTSFYYPEIYDKGFLLLYFIMAKIPFFEFRGFLFCLISFTYLGNLASLFKIRKHLKLSELIAIAIIIMTVSIPYFEVSHFVRQIFASTLLLLVVFSKRSLWQLLLGFFVTTVHLGCYPFIALMNLFYILKSLREGKYRNIAAPFFFLLVNTSYFIFIHFSKIKKTLVPTGDFEANPVIIFFWIITTIFALYLLLEKNTEYVLEQDTRQLSLILFLAWMGFRFYFSSHYFLSLRLSVFSSTFMILLLLVSIPLSERNRHQRLALFGLSSLSLIYFLGELNFEIFP